MKRGFTLAEVIIAVSIMGAFLASLITVHNMYLKASRNGPDKAKAMFLAAEGIENMRFLRDQSWSANIESVPSVAPETIDGVFVREITLDTIGEDMRQVNVGVSWSDRGATTTVSLSAVITNLYDN